MGQRAPRKTCDFPDCEKWVAAHGLCTGHSAQRRRGKELTPLRQPRPNAAEGFHWCSTCRQFRSEDDFGWDVTRQQWKRVCRPCHAESMRAYNTRNAERIRLRVTLKNWGLSAERYLALFEAQQHCCAICGTSRAVGRRNLAIDHCHDTGRIRGLLCQDCNLGMGQFADDPELLEAAAAYLRAGGVVHDEDLRIPIDSPHLKRSRERDAKRARGRAAEPKEADAERRERLD